MVLFLKIVFYIEDYFLLSQFTDCFSSLISPPARLLLNFDFLPALTINVMIAAATSLPADTIGSACNFQKSDFVFLT